MTDKVTTKQLADAVDASMKFLCGKFREEKVQIFKALINAFTFHNGKFRQRLVIVSEEEKKWSSRNKFNFEASQIGKYYGFTQKQISEILGISTRSFRRYFKGERVNPEVNEKLTWLVVRIMEPAKGIEWCTGEDARRRGT